MELDLPPLAPLGPVPTRHPDCCLSLSTTLLDTLLSILAEGAGTPAEPPAVLLSIGSGSGLLEAQLLARSRRSSPPALALEVQGVEVRQARPVNRYLPEPLHHTVLGSWHLSPDLGRPDLSALLFAYPRQPSLVSRCIAAAAAPTVIWLGPVADWRDFEPCFVGASTPPLDVEVLPGARVGLDDCEMMAVARRVPP